MNARFVSLGIGKSMVVDLPQLSGDDTAQAAGDAAETLAWADAMSPALAE